MKRLRDSDAHFSAQTAEFYRTVIPILGLRPKASCTRENAYDLLAKIGGALVEGLAVHHGVDQELARLRLPGPGGDWSAPAIGFLAILDALFEPDPDDVG